MYHIYAKVHTIHGKFTGFCSGDIETLEEANNERNQIQESLASDITAFTFFSENEPDTDITLIGAQISNSIFELSIRQSK